MAKLKPEEESISFDIAPTASHPDLNGDRGIARWWMLMPIDLLKLAGLLLIIPSLTNIKTDFFHGDTSKATLVQSAVDSSRALFTILVTVQLGQLSDTIGRRPLITLSVVCTMAPLICLASFPDDLYYYFVVYTLAGLLGGQASPAAQAYVADCSAEEDRARIFGLKGAIRSAMIMLLPSLAIMIEYYYGRRGLSFVAVILELVAFVASCMLPESLPREKRKPFVASIGCSGLVQTLRQLFLRRGSFLWDLAIFRFIKGMTTGVPIFFALKSLLALTDTDFSVLLTLTGFCGIVVQSFVLKAMLRCGCSPLSMLVLSLFVDSCYSVGLSFLKVFPEKMLLFSLAVFHSVSQVYYAAFTALATKSVHDDKGFVLGAFAAVDEVTSFLSPLLMGFIYQKSHIAPLILSACLNVACLIFVGILRRRMTQRDIIDMPLNGPEQTGNV